MIWENRRRATMSRVCLRGHVLFKRQERRTGSVGGEEGKPACSLHGYVQGVYDRQSGKRPCLPYDYVIEFSREVNFLLFYPPHVVPRTWDRIRVHRLDSEEIDGHTSYPWHPNDDMQQMAQNGSFGWDYIHLPWTLAFFFSIKAGRAPGSYNYRPRSGRWSDGRQERSQLLDRLILELREWVLPATWRRQEYTHTASKLEDNQ